MCPVSIFLWFLRSPVHFLECKKKKKKSQRQDEVKRRCVLEEGSRPKDPLESGERGQAAGMEITATDSSRQSRRLGLSAPSFKSWATFWELHKNPFYLSSTGGKERQQQSGVCYRLLQHRKTKGAHTYSRSLFWWELGSLEVWVFHFHHLSLPSWKWNFLPNSHSLLNTTHFIWQSVKPTESLLFLALRGMFRSFLARLSKLSLNLKLSQLTSTEGRPKSSFAGKGKLETQLLVHKYSPCSIWRRIWGFQW